MRVLRWLVSFGVVAFATIVSYTWVDFGLARYVHEHPLAAHAREITTPLASVPNPLVLAAVLFFFVFGLLCVGKPGRPGLWRFGAAAGVSVLVGEEVKRIAKWIFGRPWPETWRLDNPSFIRDGDYHFHWFSGGGAYDSFPSGHMTSVCAVASVVWIHYPRLRPACLVVSFAAAAILIGTNYHFFSDVLSGAFLGATVGWLVCEVIDPARRPGRPASAGGEGNSGNHVHRTASTAASQRPPVTWATRPIPPDD